MTERDFDKLLETAAEEGLPDDIVREVILVQTCMATSDRHSSRSCSLGRIGAIT